MKTCLQITLLLALVMATAVSAAQVTSINVAHETGGTVVRIDLQGPFQFTHMTEVPKDGKPDRLIVDIVGTTHTWGPKEWGSLPPCGVAKLRIGQYSSKPEKVVRVVLELAKAPVYQADSDGKSITLRLTDSSAKPFAAWTTGPAPLSAPVVPAVASTQPASKPTASTTTSATASAPKPTAPTVAAAPKTESKPADKPASHTTLAQQPASTTPASKPTVIASAPKSTTLASTPATNETASKPAAATTPTTKSAPAVALNDTKATPPSAPAVKPATAPKTESVPAPTVATQTSKPSTTTVPSQTAPQPTVALQPTQTVPATTPAADAKPSTPTVAQSAPASKPAVSEVKAPVVPANNPAAKPDQLAKVDQFKPQPAPAPSTEKSAQPSTPAAKPSTPTVAVTTPAAPSTPADKPVETNEAAPAKSDDKDASVKAPEKPLLAEADDAAGSSTPARQTARFRRSATASAKMKSSLVAEFPQRLVIKYENLGYRDPFATLIDDSRTYDTPIEKRLANVEGLRLVGILESGIGDNRALFQDKRNFSYMLKSGDKVEKGYVLRVESDKVYFQIFEYGWSRTVALTFDNRN